MKSYIGLIVLIAASCNSNISKPLEESTVNNDTVFDIGVREVQEIYTDSSELTVVVPNENFDRLDYSWVDDESDDFSISFDGEAVSLSGSEIRSAELYVRLETSITVMDEGKHCDLIDWLHGYTPWQKAVEHENFDIAEMGRANFTNPYLDYAHELPFLDVTMDEVKAEVQKNCGEFWFNHIKKCKTIYDYPCAVGISAYIFKVKYDLGNGTKKTDYFRIDLAMGC